jgi:hypothetical protein
MAKTPVFARALLGMPMPFPAISFRKSAIRREFNCDLKGGIDCEWLLQSFAETPPTGCFFPAAAVYYDVHDGQITAMNNEVQKAVKCQALKIYHQSILGAEAIIPDASVEMFTGLRKVSTRSDLDELIEYSNSLAQAFLQKRPAEALHAIPIIFQVFVRRTSHLKNKNGVFSKPKLQSSGGVTKDLGVPYSEAQKQKGRAKKYRKIAKISILLNLVLLAAFLGAIAF